MPELYPVPSLWEALRTVNSTSRECSLTQEVRMGEFAVVELPFTVTINSAA